MNSPYKYVVHIIFSDWPLTFMTRRQRCGWSRLYPHIWFLGGATAVHDYDIKIYLILTLIFKLNDELTNIND